MRKSTAAMVAFCLAVASWRVVLGAGEAPADGIERIFPPCVVATVPANRATEVDPALTQIKVTFDRPMRTERAWSWIMHHNLGTYPGTRGSDPPRWEGERTCVLPVKLAPDTVYAVGVNSLRHTGFRDKHNRVAVPTVWVFKTKAAE